jgi:hypothetical protein
MTVVPNRGKGEEEYDSYFDESAARCRPTGAEIGKRLFLRWALIKRGMALGIHVMGKTLIDRMPFP